MALENSVAKSVQMYNVWVKVDVCGLEGLIGGGEIYIQQDI